MPYVSDKIIINNNGGRADAAVTHGYCEAIDLAFKSAGHVGTELETRDLLQEPEALKFLERQESICQSYDLAHATFHDAQCKTLKLERELANDMRLWLDKKLRTP